MPNGGMLPCCFVCRWSKKDTSRPVHPQDNNPLIEPIECLQHEFAVWLPASHVCANLGDPYDGSGLSTFAERAGLESGHLYAWLEFGYRTHEHPHIPQYHHECIRLASFKEYSSWSVEEKKNAYAQARDQKERELFHGPTGQDD